MKPGEPEFAIEALVAQVKRQAAIIKQQEGTIKKAYKKLKYAWDKIRKLEAENEALRSMGGRDSGPEQS